MPTKTWHLIRIIDIISQYKAGLIQIEILRMVPSLEMKIPYLLEGQEINSIIMKPQIIWFEDPCLKKPLNVTLSRDRFFHRYIMKNWIVYRGIHMAEQTQDRLMTQVIRDIYRFKTRSVWVTELSTGSTHLLPPNSWKELLTYQF